MRRVPVAVYGTRTEADIAAARLASEGIEAMVLTDSAGGFEPQLEAVRGVRVVVWEDDAPEARLALGVEDVVEVADPGPLPVWLRLVSALTLAFVVVGLIRLALAALG